LLFVKGLSYRFNTATMKKIFTLGFFLSLTAAVSAQVVSASGWANFTYAQRVTSVLEQGNEAWVGTKGGLVKINVTSKEITFFNRANSDMRSNMVEGVTEKAGGGIWVGTYDAGMFHLQNNTFTTYSSRNSDLPGNTVYNLQSSITPAGNLINYVNTDGGMAMVQGNTFTNLNFPNTWANAGQHFMAIDPNGTLFCGTANTLWKFANNTWVDVIASTGIQPFGIRSIAVTGNHKLIVATPSTLFVQGQNGFKEFDQYDNSIPGNYSFGFVSTLKSNGDVYVARNNRIYILQGTSWDSVVNPAFASMGKIDFLKTDSANHIWVGSGDKLYLLTGNTYTKFDLSNSTLGSNRVDYISASPTGIVWTYDYAQRLNYFSNAWHNLPMPAFTSNYLMNAMAAGNQNDVYLSFYQKGIYKYKNGWQIIDTTDGTLPTLAINDLQVDKNDHLWLATVDKGLVNFDGIKSIVYNTSNSVIPSNCVAKVAKGAHGTIWALIQKGNTGFLSAVNSTGLISVSMPFSQGRQIFPQVLAAAPDGPVYIADLHGGIHQYNAGQWTTMPTDGFDCKNVTTMIAQAGGLLWVGTERNGLAFFNGQTWARFTYSNSKLTSDTINQIAIDPMKQLWVATEPSGPENTGGVSVYQIGSTTEVDHPAANMNLGQMRIFPNPATSEIQVEYSTAGGVNILSIADISGREWATYQALGGQGIRASISTENLAPGIYVCRIAGTHGQMVQKFVKQ